jgi:hypothetical protein
LHVGAVHIPAAVNSNSFHSSAHSIPTTPPLFHLSFPFPLFSSASALHHTYPRSLGWYTGIYIARDPHFAHCSILSIVPPSRSGPRLVAWKHVPLPAEQDLPTTLTRQRKRQRQQRQQVLQRPQLLVHLPLSPPSSRHAPHFHPLHTRPRRLHRPRRDDMQRPFRAVQPVLRQRHLCRDA